MHALAQHRAILLEIADGARVEFVDTLSMVGIWVDAVREAADRAEPDLGSLAYASLELDAARAKHEEVARRWELTRRALDTFAPIAAAFVTPESAVTPGRVVLRDVPVDRTARLGEIGEAMVEAAHETSVTFTAFADALDDLVHPTDGRAPWTGDGTEAARLLSAAGQASANLHTRLREYDEVIACVGSA